MECAPEGQWKEDLAVWPLTPRQKYLEWHSVRPGLEFFYKKASRINSTKTTTCTSASLQEI